MILKTLLALGKLHITRRTETTDARTPIGNYETTKLISTPHQLTCECELLFPFSVNIILFWRNVRGVVVITHEKIHFETTI